LILVARDGPGQDSILGASADMVEKFA
jgi:hypothetical protein